MGQRCSFCKAEILPDARFCIYCGNLALNVERLPVIENLVAAATGSDSEKREAAAKTIIGHVDVEAMEAAGTRALLMGDTELAEFWFVEIATADSGDGIQAHGIEELCRRVLMPSLRLAEATLYSGHAAGHPDDVIGGTALVTLEDIAVLWQESGKERFVFSDEWREFSIRGRAMHELTEYEHYLGILSFLFSHYQENDYQNLAMALKNDFMPSVTGYINGFCESLAEGGPERDTVVQAITHWLEYIGALRSTLP